jgi:hypothetical protein
MDPFVPVWFRQSPRTFSKGAGWSSPFWSAHPDEPRARPRRTFWEKVTILLAIASSDAIADTELLIEVADHKAAYFPAASARCDLARPGALRLSSPNELERRVNILPGRAAGSGNDG